MSDEFHVIKEQTTESWRLPAAPAKADARRRRTIMITDSCGADFRSLALSSFLFFFFFFVFTRFALNQSDVDDDGYAQKIKGKPSATALISSLYRQSSCVHGVCQTSSQKILFPTKKKKGLLIFDRRRRDFL